VTKDGLEVLRPGMAFVEDATPSEEPMELAHRSPGQHKKHYSPRTRVLLVSHGRLPEQGRGAYLWIEHAADAIRTIRMPARPAAYAAQLYRQLHELDRDGLDWIAVELPPGTREWAAVRDRLTRAAY
jgi:L-threonylcarbamoyladenylate synthase